MTFFPGKEEMMAGFMAANYGVGHCEIKTETSIILLGHKPQVTVKQME